MMPPRVDAPKVGKMKPVEPPKVAPMRGIDEALRYYLGPTGIPDRLAALNSMLNPVETLGGSMRASQRMLAPDTAPMGRVQAAGDMLSGVAGFAAPMVAAAKVGVPAASAVADAFTGLSTGAQKAGATVVDRLNQTNPNAPTTLHMFAGWMAKNADHDAGRRAQAMLDAGVSRDDVWRDTGWMRGVDGKMRFEIDDIAATLFDAPMGKRGEILGTTVGANIDHVPLWSSYPDIPRDVFRPVPSDAPKGLRGSYEPPANTDYGPSRGQLSLADMSMPEMRSTALHELQHAVQGREGFARGASPSEYASGAMFHEKARNLQGDLSRAITGGITSKPQEIIATARYADLQELQEIAQKYGFDSVEEALSFLKTQDEMRTPFSQYQRTAGEVEARNVQARRNMTAAERRATPPWATQDVPDDQQIVRKAIKLGQ